MVKKNFAPLSTNATCCHPELVSGSQIKNSAFTLIELLVVIVIVGILATVSVAQFNDYQERARFAKAQAFASQADTVLMAETVSTGYGFPLRLDFDEGSGTVAKDSSGSGNDVNDWSGQSANINWTNETPDTSEFALNIDNGQVRIYGIENMPVNEISYSGFVKINEFRGTGSTFLFLAIGSGASGISISPNKNIRFYMNGGGTYVESGNGSNLTFGRWHHILGSFDGANMRLFLDGNLIAEAPQTQTTSFDSISNFYIGYTSPNQEFYGDVDRVRIYPVGLDPDNL